VPIRKVRITRPFKIGTVPVTFAQWEWTANQARTDVGVRGHIEKMFDTYDYPYRTIEQLFPSVHDDEAFGRDTRPVIHVTWFGAAAYCFALTHLTKKIFRLPSETEWEYCCRAGTQTIFPWGDTYDSGANDAVNFDRRFNGTTPLDRPTYQNPFGLRHMHGQVWEWVEDFFTYRFSEGPTDGKPFVLETKDGPLRLSDYPRVVRGGSWTSRLARIRSASRSMHLPQHHLHNVGFRVVMDEAYHGENR
jgi:formylglycine-generating enzyme required for sulfatase activity